MIVSERIVSYIHSLERGNSEICEEIERYAISEHVPIIRKETESFLKAMLVMKKPKKILEIGTAVGYSAILMSEIVQEDCKITTIENYDKRIVIAKENIKKANKENQISLLEGDAAHILPKLDGVFDFIFMDAAKAQYIYFLPDILRILADDGVLISDNVLQEGDLVESHYAVPRRNRTIHSRMREYLYTIKNMDILQTSIIPIGDGIAISVRNSRK